MSILGHNLKSVKSCQLQDTLQSNVAKQQKFNSQTETKDLTKMNLPTLNGMKQIQQVLHMELEIH